jgi:two-component system response regulator MprA
MHAEMKKNASRDTCEAPVSNALQVFVAFLRRKLEDGGGQRLLHNVRGVGYVIRTAP